MVNAPWKTASTGAYVSRVGPEVIAQSPWKQTAKITSIMITVGVFYYVPILPYSSVCNVHFFQIYHKSHPFDLVEA